MYIQASEPVTKQWLNATDSTDKADRRTGWGSDAGKSSGRVRSIPRRK